MWWSTLSHYLRFRLALESFATGEPHNVSIAQEDVIGNVKILAELNKLRDIESLWKQVDDTVPDTAKETLPSADGAEKSQEPQESAEAVSSEAAKEHSEHVTDAAEVGTRLVFFSLKGYFVGRTEGRARPGGVYRATGGLV